MYQQPRMAGHTEMTVSGACWGILRVKFPIRSIFSVIKTVGEPVSVDTVAEERKRENTKEGIFSMDTLSSVPALKESRIGL